MQPDLKNNNKIRYKFIQFNPILLFFFFFSLSGIIHAQNNAILFGTLKDESGKEMEMLNISIDGTKQGTLSNKSGYYELSCPSGKEITVYFSFMGYRTESVKLTLKPNERKQLNKTMKSLTFNVTQVEIIDKNKNTEGFIRIDPKSATSIPTVSGNGIEELVKRSGMGVSSNNELSSQYNVRGGNFDENLVYVNDIEIYRPFLVRSGEQEGLSFINSDLVESIQFSSGGFESKYGDKMSSVLDITYKKPEKFGGSLSASLLGTSGHLEGCSNNKRFMYLLGIRQKTNQYILKSLDTKGEHKQSFLDGQLYMKYDFTEKLSIDFLGNYSQNSYVLIPQTRQTDFGTFNDAKRLTIYFDGQELDKFVTWFGAVSANYQVNKNLKLKLITSFFNTNESETYDVQGQYWLDQLEVDFGSSTFSQPAYNLGVGTFINHARNSLNANVFNIEQRGEYLLRKSNIQWGVKYQHEYFDDKVSEWKMIDSADYTLPHYPDSAGYTNPALQSDYPLLMQNVVKAKNIISTNRFEGFLQDTWKIRNDSVKIGITAGLRANYGDLNDEFLLSPRLSLLYKPNWKSNMSFHFSTGYYYQPPFYRELRYPNGDLNKNLKAQKSIHFVLGTDYVFNMWNRPFKLAAETYYKYLDNLVPYDVDNVRIRYYAENLSHGYAVGIDLKINGEFVKGAESWASVSVMNTEEDIKGDYYYKYYNKSGEQIISGYTYDKVAVDSTRITPGYFPRPTDQRVIFNIFFQDFLPKNPSYKVHVNLVYGSGLPFGAPGSAKYTQTHRIPAYRRVDIGFSKQLIGEKTKFAQKNPLKYIKSLWLSVEVFNLLQISNTVSYIWVTDVTNRMYPVPNYLTPRQLNGKLILTF
ncbi:MAG: TonB-dependent receptor [Bacteroidota bacterium]